MSSTTVPESPHQTGRRAGGGFYVALLPWVLFSLIAQHDTLKAAAVIALLAALGVAAPALLRGRPKLLEIGAAVAFAGLTAAAFAADPVVADWIARYARAITAAALAAIAFGSLRFTPFTEQYARESVPPALWSSDQFSQVNRRLTTMWAWVFAATIPCHVLAGTIDTRRANTIFNWVIPVTIVVWAAKRTAAAADQPASVEAE